MKHLLKLFVFLLVLSRTSFVLAQEEPQLRLTLSRDFGYGSGLQMQGTFSFRVEGPADLQRVQFLIDGEMIAEDTEAPFRYQFQTESYSLGVHTLTAVGFTIAGQELHAAELHREFVSGDVVTQNMVWIIAPIVLLVVGGLAISGWIANRGQKQTGQVAYTGPFGGTICPKCNRPFALHIWKLNLAVGALDRCPHCGKWSMVNRVAPAALQAAAEAMAAKTAESSPAPLNEQEKLRKQLEDSRFND